MPSWFSWAKKYRLKIILDLHAACGAQNCDWHADSTGQAYLWKKRNFQERTYQLWEVIAARYKDESALCGYDVLNEPVVNKTAISGLKNFYRTIIKRLQAIDKKHTIFIEGNLWAQRIDFLEDLLKNNVAVSIHTYQPLNFTFNFVPYLSYPGVIDGVSWNKTRLFHSLEPYYNFSRRNQVSIFVGEFGINYRCNSGGEIDYLNDILQVFKDYNFNYTYWTYKTIANFCLPSGVYQYLPDTPYVHRQGPVYGWENYLNLWGKYKSDIVRSWQTANYTLNKDVARILKGYFKK